MDTRHFDPEIATAKARVAGLARQDADPERIAKAQAELKAANLRARIREDVAKWPPLTEAQRADLAMLLRPGTPADSDGI